MTTVTFYDDEDNVLKVVEHSYDALNRWVRRNVDPDGPGGASAVDTFLAGYDGINPTLQFSGSAASNLDHRYLWGELVDQIFADEDVSSLSSPGALTWPLLDHLGSARDLAQHNQGTGVTSIANHRVYNAFGSLTSETNNSVDLLFGFTGKPLDDSTGLQNNLFRWYSSDVGHWLNEDPLGFVGRDGNLRRYVGNGVVNAIDPNGLLAVDQDGNVMGQHVDPTITGTIGGWLQSGDLSGPESGMWNPWTWIWTGSGYASSEIHNQAMIEGAGVYYLENAGDSHQALQNIAMVDPTGLAIGTSMTLAAFEGGDLHEAVMNNGTLVGEQTNIPTPVGNVPVPTHVLPPEFVENIGQGPGGILVAGPIPGNPPPGQPQNLGQAVTQLIGTWGPLIIGVTTAAGGMIGMALSAGEGPATPHEHWQEQVDALYDEILETEHNIEGIDNCDFGYGHHNTTGSHNHLQHLLSQLAQLMAQEPPQ